MKRADLKRLMKPLIRECIHEVLVDEGILAKVVSEVAKGMGNLIVEDRQVVPEPSISVNHNQEVLDQQKKKMQAAREQLTKSVGGDAYSNIFEGVTPAPSPTEPGHGALSDIPADDPGVDISAIMSVGGRHWKKLAKG